MHKRTASLVTSIGVLLVAAYWNETFRAIVAALVCGGIVLLSLRYRFRRAWVRMLAYDYLRHKQRQGWR